MEQGRMIVLTGAPGTGKTDGVVGPWFLEPWRRVDREGV